MISVNHEEYNKLIEERERFQMVLQGTRLGMWDWNPVTNEVYFDELWCKMLGYEIGEINNELEEWSSRVHPEDIEQCFADIQKHLSGEVDFYENTHRMKHKNGKWVYILDRGRIMKRDEEGNVIRFTGTHTDITKEREATLEVLKAKKSQELFFTMMSHELRTPLTSIIATLSLIESDDNITPETNNLIDITKYSTKHLKNLIDNLLDYQKNDISSLELSIGDYSIKRLMRDIHHSFRGILKIQNVKFEIHNSLAHDTYLLDKTRLTQTILNLISNSLKYIGEDGLIELTISENTTNKKGNIIISVKDNGAGIEKDKLTTIFEPFEQSNLEDQTKGTGLGLTLNKQLITLMGGEIWVESQVGQGANFFFTIDVEHAVDDTISNKESDTESANQQNLSHLNILIAEDDDIIIVIYKAILNRLGITNFDIARDGQEALNKFEENNYDLIFTDYHMPKMNGIELISKVRATDKTIKIIGCSATIENLNGESFLKAGCNFLLKKPFSFNEFKNSLLEAIGSN